MFDLAGARARRRAGVRPPRQDGAAILIVDVIVILGVFVNLT